MPTTRTAGIRYRGLTARDLALIAVFAALNAVAPQSIDDDTRSYSWIAATSFSASSRVLAISPAVDDGPPPADCTPPRMSDA